MTLEAVRKYSVGNFILHAKLLKTSQLITQNHEWLCSCYTHSKLPFMNVQLISPVWIFPPLWSGKQSDFCTFLIPSLLVWWLYIKAVCVNSAVRQEAFFLFIFYGGIKQLWPSCFFLQLRRLILNPCVSKLLEPCTILYQAKPPPPLLCREPLTIGPHSPYLLLNTNKVFYISSAGT